MCAIIHFGTDGWRARVDEDLTADNVARIADAVGELWQKTNPGKTVYIGFDTRPLARFAICPDPCPYVGGGL